MAEQDSTTVDWFRAAQDAIEKFRAIRGIADLLSTWTGEIQLFEDTLAEVGGHLVDLATEGLVILRYENPKEAPGPQAEAQGGAA